MEIYKIKDFMNCIKLKMNNLLNSIYSSVSPDFRFKETPYVNFFTDPDLSSSLYCTRGIAIQTSAKQHYIVHIILLNRTKNRT